MKPVIVRFWILFLLPISSFIFGAETEPVEKPGIKTLQLVSDDNTVTPGQSVTIGLFIQHIPTYHTYWKAPGIVGVPTSIEWDLPEGFIASEIEWPVPELTKMAEYDCYGYERDVCLLTKIEVPESIEVDSVIIKARVSYMCCAGECNPGWHDFELNLPVGEAEAVTKDEAWEEIFAVTRDQAVVSAPEDWVFSTSLNGDLSVQIELAQDKVDFPDTSGLHFFCENNWMNSNQPQQTDRSADKKKLILSMVKSEFAPKDLNRITGLFYSPEGWPGLGSKWVQVAAPLPGGKL